jgi:GAF domain-containing protein
MEAAIVSKVAGEGYKIVIGITRLPFFKTGDVFRLSETYCREVIRTRSTVYYNQVGLIGIMRLHPAYRSLHLESYIGTPLTVDGQLWGTLNFSSIEAREIHFTDKDIDFIETLAIKTSRILKDLNQDSFTRPGTPN